MEKVVLLIVVTAIEGVFLYHSVKAVRIAYPELRKYLPEKLQDPPYYTYFLQYYAFGKQVPKDLQRTYLDSVFYGSIVLLCMFISYMLFGYEIDRRLGSLLILVLAGTNLWNWLRYRRN